MNHFYGSVLLGLALSACAGPSTPTEPVDPHHAPAMTEAPEPAPTASPRTVRPPAVSASEERFRVPDEAVYSPAKTPPATAYADIEIGGRPEQEPAETPAAAQGAGEVGLAPEVWDETAFVRPLRRLNINQLDAALEDATNFRLLSKLSARGTGALLGLPDYLTSNQEDLRPGVVFTKVVQDTIYHHCWRVMREEWRGTVDPLVFLVHAQPGPIVEADARANLAYLLLRWHSIDVAADSAEVDVWYALLTGLEAANGANTEESWQGICVALALHPRFYTL